MQHVTIDVYQEAREKPGILTVAEALQAAQHLNHAGAEQMMHLLGNPEEIPAFLFENYKNGHPNALLFAGTRQNDQNGNEYIAAVYLNRNKMLVTEKLWLTYPMPENLRFALIH